MTNRKALSLLLDGIIRSSPYFGTRSMRLEEVKEYSRPRLEISRVVA